jgi:dipeptidyl aminopeptidase/acylaminoacyl peptidase
MFSLRFCHIPMIILLAGCATMKTLPQEYGIKEMTLMLGSGTALRYTLALPPSFSLDRSYPLVLALHYGGQVTPYYGKGYLTNLVLPALRDLEAVMIAPDCPGAGWTDPQSEEAVMELLRAIQNDYPIDSRRIVITGYSMGATGTWDIVFKHPRLFAAAIAVAGMPPRSIELNAPGTPILVIHSRDDELFPLEAVRKFVGACEFRKIEVELRVVAGLSHYHFDRFVPALREAIPWVKKCWGNL